MKSSLIKTCASFIFVLCLPLYGCKEVIIHNLSEVEANRLLSSLDEKHIISEKLKQPDGRWSLSVEKANALSAIRLLDHSRFLKTQEDPQSPRKTSMISSREDQRFIFERSLSKEIETTLASIEGVAYARVHLNLPQTDPIFGHRLRDGKGSASVLLLVNERFAQKVEELASLVAGASGIDTSGISVVVSTNEAQSPRVNDTEVMAASASMETRKSHANQMPAWLEPRTLGLSGSALLLIAGGLGILVRYVRRAGILAS